MGRKVLLIITEENLTVPARIAETVISEADYRLPAEEFWRRILQPALAAARQRRGEQHGQTTSSPTEGPAGA